MTTKELILQSIQSWPDDITMDQVIERIYFIRKLERAMRDDEAGRVTPHEEVKRMFGLVASDEKAHLDR
jgi:predicted transcriptional regulator